jgi:hypothetical protein
VQNKNYKVEHSGVSLWHNICTNFPDWSSVWRVEGGKQRACLFKKKKLDSFASGKKSMPEGARNQRAVLDVTGIALVGAIR